MDASAGREWHGQAAEHHVTGAGGGAHPPPPPPRPPLPSPHLAVPTPPATSPARLVWPARLAAASTPTPQSGRWWWWWGMRAAVVRRLPRVLLPLAYGRARRGRRQSRRRCYAPPAGLVAWPRRVLPRPRSSSLFSRSSPPPPLPPPALPPLLLPSAVVVGRTPTTRPPLPAATHALARAWVPPPSSPACRRRPTSRPSAPPWPASASAPAAPRRAGPIQMPVDCRASRVAGRDARAR